MIWLVPALIAAAAPAQVQAGQRAEIVGVIERYQRARAAGDQVALRQLLTRDVDQLVSTGEWRQGQAQAMAGMNIHLDTYALAAETIDPDKPVSLKVDDISLKSVLNLLLNQVHLTHVISDQVLKVTTDKGARGKLVTSGRAPRLASGSTASDQTGRLAGSKRSTRGSFTSSRSVGRTAAIFSRTSSAALRPSMYSWNSMMTTDWPS